MFPFILPNEKHIDTDGVIDAMGDISGRMKYFLDIISGEVGCVNSKEKKKVTKLLQDSRYLEVPKVSTSSQLVWFKDFIDTILPVGTKKEAALYNRLNKVLKIDVPETLDQCHKIIESEDKSLFVGWLQWRGDCLFEEMKKWFAGLPVKIEERFESDCDCELCKLIEKGDHNIGDFKEALQKQERKDIVSNNMDKLQNNQKNKGGIWEIAIVPEPMFGTIKPDGKPFDMVIIVEHNSYFIVNTNIINPNDEEKRGVIDAFKKAITKGILLPPDTILAKNDKIAGYLSEIAAKNGISVNIENKLKAVQEVVRSMKRMCKIAPPITPVVDYEGEDEKDSLYYDAMEEINAQNLDEAARLLSKALKIDPHYVQTYVGLSSLYRLIGSAEKYREYTIKGYEETKNIFKKWPKRLSWYDMDNRKYHRAIFYRAGLHLEDGEREAGIELYRQLLKMWPNDNLGVRYYLAAVYQGKSVDDVDKLWDWANENQKWDELERMVETENKKHHFWEVPKDE